MKKLNEMRIEKRLTSSFRITTMITSVAAIAAILVLLIISSRYTYALRYFGFAQGDIGQAIILFTDARGDTRAIVGYDDQSVINNLISQYDEDKEECMKMHRKAFRAFPVSRVYQAHIPTCPSGYWLFGFASKKYHPINDMDADAWNALNMRTRYYTSRLHVGAFYLPAFLEEMLREVEEH